MPAASQQKTGLVVVPLAIATLAYVSLIHNYFVAGDFHNFFLFLNDGLPEFLIAPHGGHLLATRNFLWWLLYQVAGMHAEVYFATVVVTHLIIVALLFDTTRRLTGSARAACVVASLWGSSPVQEGTLGWYSVYGQVMVTAILAWLLHRLALVTEGRTLDRATPLHWALLLLACVTSFGVGIGIALVFPIVAFLMLPPSRQRTRTVITLAVLAAAVPPLYRGMLQLYERLHGPSVELLIVYSGLHLPFTVLQLLVHMIGDGVIALLGGPFAGQMGYPSLVSYALAAVFVIVMLVAGLRFPPRERRLLLAGFILCLACYGLIALGRAPFCVRGPVGPIARAARYHYAATLPLALLIGLLLTRLVAWLRLRPVVKDAAVLAFAVALVVCQLRWGPRIDHHDEARRETAAIVTAVRNAIAAVPPGTDVYIENRPFASIGGMLQRRLDLFPGWAGVFIIFFPDNVVDGRQVYFVTAPEVVAKMRPGSRVASLLVTPEQRGKEHATGAARAASLVIAQQSESQPR